MKRVSFTTEGLSVRLKFVLMQVGRCLGERHRRNDAMKEETQGPEVEELGFSSNILKQEDLKWKMISQALPSESDLPRYHPMESMDELSEFRWG